MFSHIDFLAKQLRCRKELLQTTVSFHVKASPLAIDADQLPTDAILEVSESATTQQIRDAYKK